MINAVTLYETSIGKKIVMAVTGVVLFGYTVLHMVGNLKIFSGAAYLNEYSVWLREMFGPVLGYEQGLWLVRLILLASVVLHVIAAYQVSRMDIESRPRGYAVRKDQVASYAARTMRWSGVLLAVFIIFHLFHMTGGLLIPNFGGHEQVFTNMIVTFANPLVTLFYLVSMGALGLHLAHGIWSVAQTLGWRNRANDSFWKQVAFIAAVVVAGGFAIVPLAIMVGVVRP